MDMEMSLAIGSTDPHDNAERANIFCVYVLVVCLFAYVLIQCVCTIRLFVSVLNGIRDHPTTCNLPAISQILCAFAKSPPSFLEQHFRLGESSTNKR